MSEMSYLEKLLDGAEVEWKRLGDVVRIKNGKDHKSLGEGEFPVYGSGGIMRYADTYAYNKPSVLIPRKGSLGNLFFVDAPFWTVDTIFYTEIDEAQIHPKYLYYFLTTVGLGEMNQAGGVPSQTQSVLNKLKIPIPCPGTPENSLAIQSKIVRILDKFSVLTTELAAELTARKKQYNYYCDQLLNFDEDIPVVPLSDCCVSISDGDHQAPPKTDSGVPFITISNVTRSNTIDFENTYFVADDYYQRIHDKRRARKKDILYTVVGSIGIPVYIDFDMKFAFQRHIAILRTDEKKIIPKYLYHVMRSSAFLKKANSVAVGAAQKTITLSALNKMNVPIPPIGEQERIVNILDKFDTLANSLSEGLPSEIELRQKQYEYYRDMLFSFPIPDEPEA